MLKRVLTMVLSVAMWQTACEGLAQSKPLPSTPAPAAGISGRAPTAAPQAAKPAQAAPTPGKPLQLQSLDPGARADPFPPVNPKFFTADSPSVAAVESYLKAVLGYDPNRIWRVFAIQKTAAPGLAKVTVLVSERTANAKVSPAVFFITPDGKHLVTVDNSGGSVSPFGAAPFAENRALMQAKADGPAHGAKGKDLLLVEFADLQCPHCKDAQPTLMRLAEDFPAARIVFENLPLGEVHPQAFLAAEYGVCVAKAGDNAFFTYAQAVYDTQAGLTAETAEQTLKAAAVKAGADPAAIATCAATEATKSAVNASSKLAAEAGVDQTPTLVVNGRLLPLTNVPYETLRSLVAYQASQDGVAGVAAPAAARPAPTLAPK